MYSIAAIRGAIHTHIHRHIQNTLTHVDAHSHSHTHTHTNLLHENIWHMVVGYTGMSLGLLYIWVHQKNKAERGGGREKEHFKKWETKNERV